MGDTQSNQGFTDYKVVRMEVRPVDGGSHFAILFLGNDVEISGEKN